MKKTIIFFITSIFVMHNFAMEKQKHFEVPSAQCLIQAEADKVKKAYQEYGFINFNYPIKIEYCDEQTADVFAKEHGKQNLFAFNDGSKTIYLSQSFKDIPNEQRQQAIAHEMGHIVVNHQIWLNPHWWFKEIHHSGMTIASLCACICSFSHHFYNNQKGKKWMPVAIASVFGIGSMPFFTEIQKDTRSVAQMRFESMEKIEEIICDVLGAHVMPNGGAAGAALFETLIKVDGNRNGVKGDHPWTDTRIKYHKWIDTYQKLFQK